MATAAGAAISEKLLTEDSVRVKMVVSGGTATFTLTFADNTSVTSAPIPCLNGLTTEGYVALTTTAGTTCTVDGLSIIDLDGRDFNAAPVEVTTSLSDLQTANQVKLLGRTHFDSNDALVLRNSAAGFEVYTTSSTLSMSVSVSPLYSVETMNLKVWVDDAEKVINLTSATATTVTLAENMTAGVQHHIKVAKMNEAYCVYAENANNSNI